MWEEILKLAVGNGLWAVLFCALLFYELKDSRNRESKYVETISSLGEKLDIINAVKEDTEEIIELCKKSGAVKTVTNAKKRSKALPKTVQTEGGRAV